MKIDLINPYVVRIIITVRGGDSIRAVSQRIRLSYGWTYKWVRDLAKADVFRLTKKKVYINEKSEFYQKIMSFIKDVLAKDVSLYYTVLTFFGVQYCFTKTDAVFMWTKGGYNIARYREFYPIFIKVKKEDRAIFESYCRKLHLNVHNKEGVFYEVNYVDDIDASYVDDTPVDSLHETIHFMEENRYNFEPALEMIKEMYRKKINVKYKEAVTNV